MDPAIKSETSVSWQIKDFVITARKRSLWRLCFYTCLSVHRGEYLGRYSPGRYTPQAGTLLWAGTPWQVPPLAGILPGRYTLPGQYTPWAGPPPWQVHPQEQCILGDTGNKQAVHILLECILVSLWQPLEGSFILRWQRQIKSIFFVFSCHHSVNTTTSCHDTHLFCCYCHHEWVLNPFVMSMAMTQENAVGRTCGLLNGGL